MTDEHAEDTPPTEKVKPGAGAKKSARRESGQADSAPTRAPRTPAAKSTGTKAQAGKPAAAKSTAAKSSTAKSGTAQASTAKSTTAKSGTAKSATAKPAAAKSTAVKSGTAKSASAKTTAAKSAATKKAAAKPATAKAAATTRPSRTTASKNSVDAEVTEEVLQSSESGELARGPVISSSEESDGTDLASARGDQTMTEAEDAEDATIASGAEAAATESAPRAADAQGAVDVVAPRIVIDHTPDTALGGGVGAAETVAQPSAEPEAEPEAEESASVAAEPTAEREASEDNELTRADIRPRDEVTAPRASAPVDPDGAALVARDLVKHFAGHRAVDGVDLTIPAGVFYGIVGPNGAGKTTTLSMLAGLLRADSGSITVGGIDVAADPRGAKRLMGVLPDRFRTFDRLTGHQLLHYYGVLRGLKPAVVESRAADLARAFDLTNALGRSVSDYSAGMTKKVMLAGALIHSPRVLILDEPFESVDPVSSAVILDILSSYVAGGGTVILSAHGLDLVERVCSRVAFIVGGRVLAEGEVDDVRGGLTLEERFVQLSGGSSDVEGLEWLHTFSD